MPVQLPPTIDLAPIFAIFAKILLTTLAKLAFVGMGIYFAFLVLRIGARYLMGALGGFDTKVITLTDKQGNSRFIYQKRF